MSELPDTLPALLFISALSAFLWPRNLAACVCAAQIKLFCERDLDDEPVARKLIFVGKVRLVDPANEKQWDELMGPFLPTAARDVPPTLEEVKAAQTKLQISLNAHRMSQAQWKRVASGEGVLPTRRIEVDVLEPLVGRAPPQIEIDNLIGFDCLPSFEEGKTYVMEAYRFDDGTYHARECLTRIINIENADYELSVLRAWKHSYSPRRTVYGRIWHGDGLRAGLRLRLSAKRSSAITTIDSRGLFVFDDLDPDVYRLESADPNWNVPGMGSIDLRRVACAELTVEAQRSGLAP